MELNELICGKGPAQRLVHGRLTESGCFLPFPSDSFLSSCHSLNFFSGDQSPASFEGRFDFGKSPRLSRGLSGQGGRRLVIKPRKEHPLDVQMGFSSPKGRESFSSCASRASSEGGQSRWGVCSASLPGLSWRPSREASLHPSMEVVVTYRQLRGDRSGLCDSAQPCQARCQSQNDTSSSPLPHVFKYEN